MDMRRTISFGIKPALVIFIMAALKSFGCAQVPPVVEVLLNRARAANPQRYQLAIDRGAQIGVTADNRSFYLLWYPPSKAGGPALNKTLIVTMHGSASYAFDEFFLWYDAALKHGHGILALQWWFPDQSPPQDYYSPAEVYSAIEPVLKQQNLRPGRVMLHGFSRGSANGYYVSLFDRLAKNNFIGINLANAGGASTDYPLYLDVTSGKYGSNPFAGMRWLTFCGGLDPNPDRDGCPAMRRTADFIRQYGGAVDLAIEDQNVGHGGFHQSAAYPDLALTAFDTVLLRANTKWNVIAESFRIPNASIPNVGRVGSEIWLTVGGQGGIRLFRSADGSNSTTSESIPGLTSALNGTGYAPTETVPRESADGRKELYVLGLGQPGTNKSIVFRLRDNGAGTFIRDPQSAVYAGATADNQFLGVPDVYAAPKDRMRLVYVSRGNTRQNSRIALSSDGGQSFAFEYDNPFNDLNVSNPGAGNTNVDPAVLKLSQGGFLAVTMRLKKLYLFLSADGRVFMPLNGGLPVEPSIFAPNATGYFDPTLVQMPDGRILMYVTLEEGGGGQTSVARATLSPQGALISVSAASFTESTLAPESIAAAFGINLATGTQTAPGTELPTQIEGVSIKLIDSAGAERLAPLFFISPAQINFQVGANTASGEALIQATDAAGTTSTGNALISGVAPGLFSANSDGQGIAAALVLRVQPDGLQSYELTARYDQSLMKFVSLPVNTAADPEQVFLVLYGTGIRNRSNLSNVSVKIGGIDAQVTFAGAQGEYTGLDQVNIRLAKEFAGRGDVVVELIVDGRMANPVNIYVR